MGKLPLLSQNGEKIVDKLLSLPSAWITSNTLAESIGISKRTIMRELPGVEKWFLAAGVELKRSQGKGILLEADEKKRGELKDLSGLDACRSFPEKERRVREIFTMLLLSKEPVKQFLLADEVGVSERTLSGDLDQLAEWLEKQGLSLVRKSGVGIWLEGDEDSRRRAVNHLLYEQYPQETLDAMFQTGKENGRFDISRLLDVELATAIKDILHEFEISESLQFADAGFITLALHLSLLIQHLKFEEGSSHYNNKEAVSEKTAVSAIAQRLIGKLENRFQVSIPDYQAEYLTRYLDAYRGRMSDEGPESHEMDVRYLASVLIQCIESELCVDLSAYPTLADDLSNHLRAMIHRMQTGVYTDNPQLDLIRQQYSWLWDATRMACDVAYEMQAVPDMKPISDEEAGFLAMHFGAVLEQDDVAQMRIQTIIVCPLGLASSRFLTSQLTRDYPVLHIQKTCSVRDISKEFLEAAGIDLLISTTPLNIDYPYIKVNTILQSIDHTLLDEAVRNCQDKIRQQMQLRKEAQAVKENRKEISAEQEVKDSKTENRNESSNSSGVRYLNRVSRMLIDLYENVRVKTVNVPGKRKKLIEEAAGLFAKDAKAKAEIENGLLRREEIADTYIKPLRALLLHCKTGEIDGCRLGYLIAQPPVYEPGRMIQGALVLLASEDEDELPVKVMQAVSGLLIDNPKLIEALREGRESDAVRILEEGLTQIYRGKRKL